MFPLDDRSTASRSTANMPRRAPSWEPLYEVTQIKGDGETHPYLSPNDEFANFETLGQGQSRSERGEEAGRCCEYEYARAALQDTGCKLEAKLGANPFKFGMIGSTDSHTGLATAEENNFCGKFPPSEPSPKRSSIRS